MKAKKSLSKKSSKRKTNRTTSLSSLKKKKSKGLVGLIKSSLIILLSIHIVVFGLSALVIFSYKFLNPALTNLSVYRWISGVASSLDREFISIGELDKGFQDALIRLEDPSFRRHSGLDIRAMRMAYRLNKRYGRKIAGGSTITQQLARTLFLTPHKSYLRKYMELIIALQLELILEKDRILELYFNNVEFGPGVYGIGAGSRYHFNRGFLELNPQEQKSLLVILPNPILYSTRDIDKVPILSRRKQMITGRKRPVLRLGN